MQFPLPTTCFNVALNSGVCAITIWINIENGERGKSLVITPQWSNTFGPDCSKKDVLKVLKSESELKDFSNAVHAIYYKITGNSPVGFRHDECIFLFNIRRLLIFYYENKPKRNNFNFRYVLYYLLKRRNYPVTLEDFPEIRGSSATEKLCNDFFTSNCT